MCVLVSLGWMDGCTHHGHNLASPEIHFLSFFLKYWELYVQYQTAPSPDYNPYHHVMLPWKQLLGTRSNEDIFTGFMKGHRLCITGHGAPAWTAD